MSTMHSSPAEANGHLAELITAAGRGEDVREPLADQCYRLLDIRALA